MKKLIPLCTLLMFVLFSNCSNDDGDANPPDDQLNVGGCETTIPFLETGNTFTYTVSGNPGGATITIGSCNDDGYSVSRAFGSITGTDIWRQNGEFLEVDSNSNGDYWAKTYKLNAELGEVWTHTQADGTVSTHEVVSVDSTITVPAGTFTCKVFSYTTTSIANTNFIFWNDDIGQIKESGFFTIELESY